MGKGNRKRKDREFNGEDSDDDLVCSEDNDDNYDAKKRTKKLDNKRS